MTHSAERTFKPFIPEEVYAQRARFPQPQPLVVEIGCGVGLHPITFSRRHPDVNMIAIEHTRNKFERLQRRIASHTPQPANLAAINANAISWLAAHGQPASLAAVFLLYPNPWPKSRHSNQRWHHMPFMAFLLSRLVPGGTLTMATNLAWYAAEAEATLRQRFPAAGITLANFTKANAPPHIGEGRSHFERKYLAAGQTCHELTLCWPG